ncbi:MAG: thioredoxin [Porticoccaceae bacterium]|nr:thioredoxin [Porticoccaceae bacterium]
MNEHIVDVTLENAQQILIEESAKRLVLVDFWADWCAPCKALMPILEKLAEEYKGQFLLAKVNADQQPDISAQFGVRSLPSIIMMKDGQPVDGFQGALPETEIRAKLDLLLPKIWDALMASAQEKMAAGDFDGALPDLNDAYTQSAQDSGIGLALAQTLLQVNRCDQAETVLKNISLAEQDAYYEQLMAQLELKREASKSPEIIELERQLSEDPDNTEAAYQLALQYSQNHNYQDALELLLGILQRDKDAKGGEVKQGFLDVLAALGKGDPVAVQYQRKFFNILH